MKVRDILGKFTISSNASVHVKCGSVLISSLSKQEIFDLKPDRIMDATVNSFNIIDNVMTIYVRKGVLLHGEKKDPA